MRLAKRRATSTSGSVGRDDAARHRVAGLDAGFSGESTVVIAIDGSEPVDGKEA